MKLIERMICVEGLFGKFLDVDLSPRTLDSYEIPEDWMEKYLGGRGLGARILLEEMDGGEDPLGPESILIFSTGPLQGTGAPGAGRNLVMSKSPKTGGVSGSYVGGFLPHELGTSGYDGILVRGRADSPVYITLRVGEAEIHDAGDLWGREVADVDEELRKRHEGGRVASIGIAGENLVKFSCIMNDRNRAAGRPGFGAVMGSKNLKALLVKGGIEKHLYDDDEFREVQSQFVRKLSPVVEWGKYGTTGALNGLNAGGILPTKNFQEGVFDGSEKISGETMYDEILVDRDNCTGCPVRCKRVVETEFGDVRVEDRYGGPEYETLASFGSLCMNDDLDSIALANQKCNKYGLDTISTGNLIAFAMEASEKGLIEEDIRWGNPQAIVELIDRIAHREGLGDLMAGGIDEFADEIGADFAMQVKGQEIPMHEPRGKKALAISYAVSPRGANHMEVLHDAFRKHPAEMGFDEQVDRFDLQGKPGYCYVYENLVSFTNSVIYCAFHGWVAYFRDGTWTYPEIRKLVEAATGLEIGLDEMLTIGERNFNLLKVLSVREGISRGMDGLPKRFEEPLPRGRSSGEPISNDELGDAVDEYYDLRGWDDLGPTREKLEELGMEELQDHIDQ